MIAPTQSSFLRNVVAPPIPAAREWARGYAGAVGPMIDLTQAVPGYPAHPDLLDRLAVAAGDPAAARYGDIAGDMTLRGTAEGLHGLLAALETEAPLIVPEEAVLSVERPADPEISRATVMRLTLTVRGVLLPAPTTGRPAPGGTP